MAQQDLDEHSKQSILRLFPRSEPPQPQPQKHARRGVAKTAVAAAAAAQPLLPPSLQPPPTNLRPPTPVEPPTPVQQTQADIVESWNCGHCRIVFTRSEEDLRKHMERCILTPCFPASTPEDANNNNNNCLSVLTANVLGLTLISERFAHSIQHLQKQQLTGVRRKRSSPGDAVSARTPPAELSPRSRVRKELCCVNLVKKRSPFTLTDADVALVVEMLRSSGSPPAPPTTPFLEWIRQTVVAEDSLRPIVDRLPFSSDDSSDLIHFMQYDRFDTCSFSPPSSDPIENDDLCCHVRQHGFLFREIANLMIRAVGDDATPPPPLFALDMGVSRRFHFNLQQAVELHGHEALRLPFFVYDEEDGWRPISVDRDLLPALNILRNTLYRRIEDQCTQRAQQLSALKTQQLEAITDMTSNLTLAMRSIDTRINIAKAEQNTARLNELQSEKQENEMQLQYQSSQMFRDASRTDAAVKQIEHIRGPMVSFAFAALNDGGGGELAHALSLVHVLYVRCRRIEVAGCS